MDDLPPTHPSRRRHRSRVRPRSSAGMLGSPAPADASVECSPMSCPCGGLAGGMTGADHTTSSTDNRQRRTRRRRRHAQATASAVLALGALVVLSGDLLHLPPGFHATLSALLSTSRRRLAEDSSPSSATTEDLLPVSGVRTATFFLPVEPHLKHNNKMNSHFSLPQYAQGLANTCQFLARLDYPAYVLGDQDFVTGRAQTCQELSAEKGGRYQMEDLKHEEAAAMVQRHMCRRKMAADKHDPRRILKEHVLMYLNKLEVLCDLAQTAPHDLTVLVDSDLDPELWSTVLSLIDRRKKDARDSTLTVYEHPDYGYRSWFGRPSCRTHPTVDTEFMAIRGKDCPAILQAFETTIDGLVETASKVNLLPDAGPCPCFDDEIVLHYLKKDHPEMISFFGVPRTVPTDDDDSLFDEDVADEVDFGEVGRMLKNRNRNQGDDGDGDADEDGGEGEDEDDGDEGQDGDEEDGKGEEDAEE